MKVRKIELNGYNQFENVVLDLTYPNGHKKQGQPLDKVCFIGQSGTGKTSLLRLIKWFISEDDRVSKDIKMPPLPENCIRMYFRLIDLNYSVSNVVSESGFITSNFSFSSSNWSYGKRTDKEEGPLSDAFGYDVLEERLQKKENLLINYPADLSFKGHFLEPEDFGNPLEYMDNIVKKKESKGTTDQKYTARRIVDFAFEDIKKTWDIILKDIKEHRAQELLYKNKIADSASKEDFKVEEIEEKTKEYKKWLSQNPDPLKKLAEICLDPILHNLGLKTKTDIDLKSIRDLGFIELKTLCGVTVPRDFWSTGTRQLVQTMVPLYQLKPDNAVILIDEPERSIYPDIQKNIIDSYVGLAPGCQFFFATHSPIIASAFEPWEIVELKFDETHEHVYRELHYQGENHVDNYTFHPGYLRWDSILRHVFDLEEEGHEIRIKALGELAELNVRIRKLKKQKKLDSTGGKKLTDQYLALCRKLDWPTDKE